MDLPSFFLGGLWVIVGIVVWCGTTRWADRLGRRRDHRSYYDGWNAGYQHAKQVANRERVAQMAREIEKAEREARH